jgi:hypothetical protein
MIYVGRKTVNGEIAMNDVARWIAPPPATRSGGGGLAGHQGGSQRANPGRGRDTADTAFNVDLDGWWGSWESLPPSFIDQISRKAPGTHLVGDCCLVDGILQRADGTHYLPASAWRLTRDYFAIFTPEEEVDKSFGRYKRPGRVKLPTRRWALAPGSLRIDSGLVQPDSRSGSGSADWRSTKALDLATVIGDLSYLPAPVREQILRYAPTSREQEASICRYTLDGIPTEYRLRGFRSTGKRVIAVDAHRATTAHSGVSLDSLPWQVSVFRAEFQQPGATKKQAVGGSTSRRKLGSKR